jgi:VCBS repeat-containing protein
LTTNRTDEDTVLSVGAATGLLANDLDFDGNTLGVSAVEGRSANVGSQITLASGALLTVAADGGYSYDPNGRFGSLAVGESTTDSFTYSVSDGHGGGDSASDTVTVTPVDDIFAF